MVSAIPDFEIKKNTEKAVEIVVNCIRWLLVARDEEWVGKKCLQLTCAKCESTLDKPNCTFNTARAVMALSRARHIWKHLDPSDVQEIFDALIDGTTHLLKCAVDDDTFKPGESYCWWSSDITLGEHRIEVVRTTAATVVALIEFKRFSDSDIKPRFSLVRANELERKIRGGVYWLRKTMICDSPPSRDVNSLPARVISTTTTGVPGYQAFAYYGSWMNIPVHIYEKVQAYYGKRKKRLMAEYYPRYARDLGTAARLAEERLEKVLEKPTDDTLIEVCRNMMGIDCVKYLIKASLPRMFDVECTKDALMALAVFQKEYHEDILETKQAIKCLDQKRDRNGLWSELICMNFHTLVALLLAGIGPSEKIITDALEYLNSFESATRQDICLLVSKTLVEFFRSDMKKADASEILNKYIDRIRFLARQPNLGQLDTPQVFCYIFDEDRGCAVPQTSWAIYTLSILLEQLGDMLNSSVGKLTESHKTTVDSNSQLAHKLAETELYAITLHELDEKLTKEKKYRPATSGSWISDVRFDKVYEKAGRWSTTEELLVIKIFGELDETDARRFMDDLKRLIKDGEKIKNVVLLVASDCEKNIVDMLDETKQATGTEIEILNVRKRGA